MLWLILKKLLLTIALVYVVAYAFPYVTEYFTGTQDHITGFAARNLVGPAAQAVADRAQAIADRAAPPPTRQFKFFPRTPDKDRGYDPSPSRNNPPLSESGKKPEKEKSPGDGTHPPEEPPPGWCECPTA